MYLPSRWASFAALHGHARAGPYYTGRNLLVLQQFVDGCRASAEIVSVASLEVFRRRMQVVLYVGHSV